jgi:hypothetical protein
MTMVSLPLWMHRHPFCCRAGIVALVTMALTLLIRKDIVALFAMASLPSSSWRHCPCCIGIVIIINGRHLCHHHNCVFALVAMVLLPLMHRHLCRGCNGHCCPHDNVIVAIVDVQASLPLPSWRCHPLALLPLICSGLVALATMALLPSLSWHCHPHSNGAVGIINVQASLPSLQWRCRPCCKGVVAIDPLQLSRWGLSPLLQWCLYHSQASIVVKLALLLFQLWGCCHHQCAGVFAVNKLASLPVL